MNLKVNYVGQMVKKLSSAVLTMFMACLVLITLMLHLPGSPFQIFRLDSGSMQPTLPVNSLVVTHKVSPEKLSIGDIVTYTPVGKNQQVTHRIVKSVGHAFQTKGDANNQVDTQLVAYSAIQGKVAFKINQLGGLLRNMHEGLLGIFLLGLLIIVGGSLLFKPSVNSKEKIK